ncbi:MAG: hypothetical protein NTW66_00525 [Candidatus Magasanikbacteria bacterium]|nr:hypothetical protein [Candidatus Magasanikbacteria bacterium]
MANTESSNQLAGLNDQNFSQARKAIKNALVSTCDPKHILKKFDELLVASRAEKDEKKFKVLVAQIDDMQRDALAVLGLENHYPIVETITDNRPLIIELANQLTEEFGCLTASEKALVHLVAGAYGRIIEYSKLFNNCRRIDDLTKEKIGYYSMISKELDRAERHFVTALVTLRQFKEPALKVNIKTNNAFIAQNQQLNSNTNENNQP